MALADVQAALARLFTDESLRAAFFADPVAVGRSLGLEEPEATGLARLAPRPVEQFAATLRRKRVDDARKAVPLTALALGDSFAPLVLASIPGPLPPGRHRDDARFLADHLARLARSDALDPPWAADLACYELAFVEAFGRRACLIVRRFRYPVGSLARAVRRGEPIVVTRPRRAVGIWMRIPGRRGVFHRLV